MNIDIRTLAIILGTLDILLIVAILIPFPLNKTYRGIGWWVLWSAANGAGFLFMLSRDIVPDEMVPASILLTNALLLAGQIFLYTGIMRFLVRKENRLVIIAVSVVFVLSTIYVMYVSEDAAARTLILYTAVAIFSFMAAQGLFAHKQRAFAASANFIAAVLFILGCYLALRSLAAITIAPIDPVFTSSLMQAATFLISLIAGTLCMAGLIIMVFQRANAELREVISSLQADLAWLTRQESGVAPSISAKIEDMAKTVQQLGNMVRSIETSFYHPHVEAPGPSDKVEIVKPPHENLSVNEHIVMVNIILGKPIKQIAHEMGISPSTASTYRARLLKKMNMSSDADLIRYALQHGVNT